MNWTVPTLAECRPGVEPVEYKILVARAERQEKTAGGIILTADTLEREQFGSSHARLVAVSPLAFTYANWPEGSRVPQVGDVVFVGKYAGEAVIGSDEREYFLCDDREIKAVVERSSARTAQAYADYLRQIGQTATQQESVNG